MSAPRLTGVIAPVLTPFATDGTVDLTLFRREVRHLLEAGVHGISPGGSTGEGAALTDTELATLVDVAVEQSAGMAPVVAGVIRSSTSAAIAAGSAAREAGADALMVTPTFYNVLVPDESGNQAFYQAISDEVGLPIIVYNVVPQNTIGTDLATRLLDIEHVIGVKQSVGGIMAMYDVRQATRGTGLVYAATDEMLASCFSLGADGAISAIVALFPRTCLRMWDLTRSGRHDDALALQNQLYPVWQAIAGAQFPARMKAAARILGRDCGFARSPLVAVPAETEARLAAALDGLSDE